MMDKISRGRVTLASLREMKSVCWILYSSLSKTISAYIFQCNYEVFIPILEIS